MYTDVRSFLGDSNPCVEGSNIIQGLQGSAAYEFLKLAEQERNERSRDRMKKGVHNFQVYARNMFDALCVKVREGDDVLSMYQSMLMMKGKHNFQVHAKKMLEEMGVKVQEGDDVLSMYQSILMIKGKHNFQVNAKRKLEEIGVKVLEGNNVNNMYQSKLVEKGENNLQKESTRKKNSKRNIDLSTKGEHNFQNLSEDTKHKRNIKVRLKLLDKALVKWDVQLT